MTVQLAGRSVAFLVAGCMCMELYGKGWLDEECRRHMAGNSGAVNAPVHDSALDCNHGLHSGAVRCACTMRFKHSVDILEQNHVSILSLSRKIDHLQYL